MFRFKTVLFSITRFEGWYLFVGLTFTIGLMALQILFVPFLFSLKYLLL